MNVMVAIIKNIIKTLFSYSLVWNSVGIFFRKRGLIVLMYHRIGVGGSGLFHELNVDTFNMQMRWLKKNCNVIHPDDFVDGLLSCTHYKPTVLITFDDGYKCCYDYAYPVLKKLSLPALVFIATEPLDNGTMIWTDLIQYLIKQSNEPFIILPWDNLQYTLNSNTDKQHVISQIKKYLKNTGNNDRIKYIDEIKERLKISTDYGLERQMLNWNEVRDSLDTVTYGGHTHNHPIMSKISETELCNEITTCRDRIYFETGITPRYFAYPNGRFEDYNESCISMLKQNGFELAYTTNEGVNRLDTNLMEIKRLPTSAKLIQDFVWLILFKGN